MIDPMHDIPFGERTIGHQLGSRLRDAADKPFLSMGNRRWTFGDGEAMARACARGLARIGIGAGDRVALILPNCPEFVFTWFGNALLGAVTIPIDPRKAGAFLEYTLTDAKPRCLVVAVDLLPLVDGVSPAAIDPIEHIVVVGEDGATLAKGLQSLKWDELLVFEGSDPEIEVDFSAIGMIMYTSGSSGPAKGVMMPNAHMFMTGMAMMRAVDLRPDDVLFTPFPLFHGMASRVGVLPALAAGVHVVVGERFSASAYWRQAYEANATIGIVVPTIASILMAQPPGPFDQRHYLRAMFNSKHDPAFESRFKAQLIESYGMTEISHVISAAYHERRPGSAGRRQENWDVKTVDDDGGETPVGEPGEIVVRPRIPNIMMAGYLNKPKETAALMQDGWFHTGDYGYFDSEGYFYFTGRKAERIRRLGENVSAEQLEGVVNSHPAVAESAALPFPSPLGEDDIRLVVSLREEHAVAPEDLSAWLQEQLPRFMRPRYIEFVPQLPRTESGKVGKLALIRQGLAENHWDSKQADAGRQRKPEPQNG